MRRRTIPLQQLWIPDRCLKNSTGFAESNSKKAGHRFREMLTTVPPESLPAWLCGSCAINGAAPIAMIGRVNRPNNQVWKLNDVWTFQTLVIVRFPGQSSGHRIPQVALDRLFHDIPMQRSRISARYKIRRIPSEILVESIFHRLDGHAPLNFQIGLFSPCDRPVVAPLAEVKSSCAATPVTMVQPNDKSLRCLLNWVHPTIWSSHFPFFNQANPAFSRPLRNDEKQLRSRI